MPPVVRFQGVERQIQSIEEFGKALDEFDKKDSFELWLDVAGGPGMCMRRHFAAAWLLYLEHECDAGCTSIGNPEAAGLVEYRLNNGQVDEYSIAWCLDVEECYKAMAYFYVNEGLRPNWIKWRES
jgi:hypothetical protein